MRKDKKLSINGVIRHLKKKYDKLTIPDAYDPGNEPIEITHLRETIHHLEQMRDKKGGRRRGGDIGVYDPNATYTLKPTVAVAIAQNRQTALYRRAD